MNEQLTPKQTKLVNALLQGITVRAAAKLCDIPEKTAHYYKAMPHIKQALAEGTEEIKRHGFEQIALVAPIALNTIIAIMNDEENPVHVRLRAAHILASRLTDVKPVEQPQTVQDADPYDYAQLDDNELNLLMTLQEKAKRRDALVPDAQAV